MPNLGAKLHWAANGRCLNSFGRPVMLCGALVMGTSRRGFAMLGKPVLLCSALAGPVGDTDLSIKAYVDFQ